MDKRNMSNERRKPILDLQACYSGFKVEELEYIGYNRTSEDHSDDFLDTLDAGPLDHGACSDDEEDEMLGQSEYDTGSLSAEEVRSYLCSTPTRGRKYRGLFRHDSDMSGLNDLEPDSSRNFPSKLDSGFQTRNVSAANSVISYFGDENGNGSGSLESLPGSSKTMPFNSTTNMRKRIELDSDLHDPYNSNVDDLEISIEEEISHLSQTSAFGTLKRRLSLKVMRRKVSTGLFGSYLQRTSTLPPAQSHQSITSAVDDQAYLFNNTKPTGTGPVNFWFKKFRNRHFI